MRIAVRSTGAAATASADGIMRRKQQVVAHRIAAGDLSGRLAPTGVCSAISARTGFRSGRHLVHDRGCGGDRDQPPGRDGLPAPRR
jgi:hypothetical protein